VYHQGGSFEIWVNPEVGGDDIKSFADSFAGWAPEVDASRRLNSSDIRMFLHKIETDNSCMQVSSQTMLCSLLMLLVLLLYYSIRSSLVALLKALLACIYLCFVSE